MSDTFPGLQQDCLDLITKCEALLEAARTCRADAQNGSREGVRIQVQEMDRQAAELAEFCQILNDTTDHLDPEEPDEGGDAHEFDGADA